jgi:hypothetical protein
VAAPTDRTRGTVFRKTTRRDEEEGVSGLFGCAVGRRYGPHWLAPDLKAPQMCPTSFFASASSLREAPRDGKRAT